MSLNFRIHYQGDIALDYSIGTELTPPFMKLVTYDLFRVQKDERSERKYLATFAASNFAKNFMMVENSKGSYAFIFPKQFVKFKTSLQSEIEIPTRYAGNSLYQACFESGTIIYKQIPCSSIGASSRGTINRPPKPQASPSEERFVANDFLGMKRSKELDVYPSQYVSQPCALCYGRELSSPSDSQQLSSA